jgi:hypothetical protein
MAAVSIASLAQAVTGFGFALLAVPAMALFVDTRDAVMISALLGTFTSAVQAWTDRGDTDALLARRLLIASAAGMPIGLVAFTTAPEALLRGALGVMVLSATWVLWRGAAVPTGPRMDWTMGFVSGVLNTSLSTNGPPLVFLLQARGVEPARFRATLYRVFAVMGSVTLALFAASGRIDVDTLVGSAVALPASLGGLLAGWRVRRALPSEKFRGWVLALLALSGASALLAAAR